MGHIMECVKIRRLLLLLLVVITISFAILAVSSAAEILQGPSFRTVNNGVDGSTLHSAAFGGNVVGGVQPIVGGFSVPTFKNADGTVSHGYGIVGLVPVTTGIQGPGARTVNVGPDGSVIDSFTAGGVVSDDGSVLIAPYHHAYYKYADNLGVVPNVVHTVIPGVKSYYAPGFYSGFVPLPYGGSVVAGPSGTIVAK